MTSVVGGFTISLENDCNGTSLDAYLQLTFSLKHIGFSGGYNFASEVLMGAKK